MKARAPGLGLAQVYGLMRQWGGFVEVQSQAGVDTTMTLADPGAAREMKAVVEADAPA